jgi:hypothetical protein
MSITLTAREARPASGLILLTMSLGVLIAQIDTSVVNLAVKPIGKDLNRSNWDHYRYFHAAGCRTLATEAAPVKPQLAICATLLPPAGPSWLGSI